MYLKLDPRDKYDEKLKLFSDAFVPPRTEKKKKKLSEKKKKKTPSI